MFVENPEVTLEEEGHGFPEGAGRNGGIEWSITVNAQGDDGRQYWIDTGMMGYRSMNILLPSSGISEGADMGFMAVRWVTSQVSAGSQGRPSASMTRVSKKCLP